MLRFIAFCGIPFILFWELVSCTPLQPSTPSPPIYACSNLLPYLHPPIKAINHNGLYQPSSNHSAQVTIDHTVWSISNTLALHVTICNWETNPATILEVLEAAESAVGKKPAAGLLQGKFTQKSKNKFNKLYFEITPGFIEKLLTWGDVGEVLGENGLRKFFLTTLEWHTIYFDVMHTERGKLGYGSVRRWWQ
ncbi:MAG: hypothetical protein LQ350_004638 [Teloschistes chrysophthalmus]|nr:MAG: hypothetical protein LQ350_004638 [Niorma chrysophthalma]